MKTIDLPPELETFVDKAVRAGLYANEDDVIRDALDRLKQSMTKSGALSDLGHREDASQSVQKPMSDQQFKEKLIESGLMTSQPTYADPSARPVCPPVPIEGELLSETIIRERR